MKKNLLTALAAFWFCNVSAQQSSGDGKSYLGNINEMFAAAPTANNLMKFEEVPVSYYSGIPDINIPLLNIASTNKNVSINLQLKYHPLNAKPEDRSGETGLGWSLIAGGTISRTVRGGAPDEKGRKILYSSPPKAKYGIYDETNNPTAKIIRGQGTDMNNYRFDVSRGKFDTEYDLYQYNFMGQSGRFYIVKDENGNLIAEKLDKNNLLINVSKNFSGEIDGFTITDDKGIKFIFEGMEKSSKSILSTKIGLVNGSAIPDESSEIADYWSSFHLVKIQDQNNLLLAAFTYDLTSSVKFDETPTTTKRLASDVEYTNNSQYSPNPISNPDSGMPGAIETQFVSNINSTKLLTSINIPGKGKVYLNYEKGRDDSNYMEPQELYALKSVHSNYIGQSSQQYTEKFVFDYNYTHTDFINSNDITRTLKKMILKKISKISTDLQSQEYTLDYITTTQALAKDKWGYYKGSNQAYKTDVLKSITYPTKGKTEFDFGLNDFSKIGENPVTGEWNTTERSYILSNVNAFNEAHKEEYFTILSPQKVALHLDLLNLIYLKWNFKLYKKNPDNTFSAPIEQFGMDWQSCISTGGTQCANQNLGPDGLPITEVDMYTQMLDPGTYYISLSGNHGLTTRPITYNLIAYTKDRVFESYSVKSGGGLRINNIKYFADNNSSIPAKEFEYNCRSIEDNQKSSGSLVFPEPIMSFEDTYFYRDKHTAPYVKYKANLTVTTDYNILPVQKTQGSDVGYKYITVIQKDQQSNPKGRTVYKYRSPADYSNIGELATQLPVFPIPNLDYLRGQLIAEKKYDADGRVLSESSTEFTTKEFQKVDGVKILNNYEKNTVAEYYTVDTYANLVSTIFESVTLTTPFLNYEKFGVTLPTQKTETSYFYKNGIQSSVSKTTNTLYNTLDYPTFVTQLFSDGDSNVVSYKYAHEKNNTRLINANMIGVALETENKKNNKVISKVETLYNDINHYLPTSLATTDFAGVVSTEVTYDHYDSRGNLLQYTTKNGIPTAIIWGYNGTQPIAKITGAPYTQVSSLASAIITASDNDASAGANNDETSFLGLLDNFRKELALTRYQITTYTYDPLIGVRSITPPSGIREVYTYDSANRLENIKDVNGKMLKEFKYNYKH